MFKTDKFALAHTVKKLPVGEISTVQPIDLTTYAADVPLPPQDHPIFSGPIKQASDIPSLDWPRERIVQELIMHDFRLRELETWQQKQLQEPLQTHTAQLKE